MLQSPPKREEGPLASLKKMGINTSSRYACAAIVSEEMVDLPVNVSPETGCDLDGGAATAAVRNSASIWPPKATVEAGTVEGTNNSNNRAQLTSDHAAGTRAVSATDNSTATSVTSGRNGAKKAAKGRHQNDITTATTCDKEQQEELQRRVKRRQPTPKRERTAVPKEKEEELTVPAPAGKQESSVMARSVAETPENAKAYPVKKKEQAKAVAVAATCTRAPLTSAFKQRGGDGKEIEEVEERSQSQAKGGRKNTLIAQVLCRRANSSYRASWALLLVTFVLATAFAASGLAVIVTYFISKESENSPNELVAAFNAAVASFDNTIPRKWLPSNVIAWREKVPADDSFYFSSSDASSSSQKKTLFLRYGTSRVNVLFSAQRQQQRQQGQPQPQDAGVGGELNEHNSGGEKGVDTPFAAVAASSPVAGAPIQFSAASIGASSSTSSTVSAAEIGVRTAYSAFLGENFNPQSIAGGPSNGGPPGMDLRYSFTFNLNGVGVGVRMKMKSPENRDANHNNENDNQNGSARFQENLVTIRNQPLTVKPRVGKYVKQAVYCNNAKGGCTLDFLRNSCGNNENYGRGTFIRVTTTPPTTDAAPNADNADTSKESDEPSSNGAVPLPPPISSSSSSSSSSRLCPYSAFCGYCIVPRYLSEVCLVVVKNDHRHDDNNDGDSNKNNDNNKPLDFYFDLGTAVIATAVDDNSMNDSTTTNKNEEGKEKEEEGNTNTSGTMSEEQSVDVNNNNASSTTGDENITSLPRQTSSAPPTTPIIYPQASAAAVLLDQANTTSMSDPNGEGNGLPQTTPPLTSCFYPFYADAIDVPSYSYSKDEEGSAVTTANNESPSQSSVAADHTTHSNSSATDAADNNIIELPAIHSSRRSFERSGGYVYNNPTPTAPVKISILHATDPFVVLQRLTKGTNELSLNPSFDPPYSSSADEDWLASGAEPPLTIDDAQQQQQKVQTNGGQRHNRQQRKETMTLISISITCFVIGAAFYLAALGIVLWRWREIRREKVEEQQQQHQQQQQQQQGQGKQENCHRNHVLEGSSTSLKKSSCAQ